MKRLFHNIPPATSRWTTQILTTSTVAFFNLPNTQAAGTPCKTYEAERSFAVTSVLQGINSVTVVGNDRRGAAWKIEGIRRIASGCDRQVRYDITTTEDLTQGILLWFEQSVKANALGIEEIEQSEKESAKSFRLVIRTTAAHLGLRSALRSLGERVIITEEPPGYTIVAPSIDSETIELRYGAHSASKKSIATNDFLFRLKDSLGLAKLAELRNARNTESPAYRKNRKEVDDLIELASSVESYYRAFINAIKSNQKAFPHTPEVPIKDLHISTRIHPVKDSVAAKYFESLFYGPKDKTGPTRTNDLAKLVVKSMSHGERFSKDEFEARAMRALEL